MSIVLRKRPLKLCRYWIVLGMPFMQIRQAMAIVRGRPDASAYLRDFVQRLARAGTTGDILERHGVARACAIVPGDAA